MFSEVALTTARPETTMGWAINGMRKVPFDVSVSLLRTAECGSTNGACWAGGSFGLIGLSVGFILGLRWRDGLIGMSVGFTPVGL